MGIGIDSDNGTGGGAFYGEDRATLGDRIAAAREHAGLSAGQLAHRLGLRVETLARWESDHAEPRANRMQMLAGVLGVSLVWLMTGEGRGPGEANEAATDTGARVAAELREVRRMLAGAAERLARLEAELA